AIHPECYWRNLPDSGVFVHAAGHVLKSGPIKNPELTCLQKRQKIEVSIGCYHQCVYCYGYSRPRYYPRGLVLVNRDLPHAVVEQLRGMLSVKPIYLSPNSDPFQRGFTEGVTERLVELLVSRGLSFYFVTKGVVTKKVLDLLDGYPYFDAQLSITTVDEEKRRTIEPNTPTISERLENIENLVEIGVKPVVRIDPLLPFYTDDPHELETLLKTVIDLGARHIIVSYVKLRPEIWGYLKNIFEHRGLGDLVERYEDLFFTKPRLISNFNVALESYRYKNILWTTSLIKRLSSEVTFATCLEDSGHPIFRSMWSSPTCEAMNLPVMKRIGNHFAPIQKCSNCNSSSCSRCEYLTSTSHIESYLNP
ncbi:MAG: radical SAM protein, partial [Nitrososphaerales archaeon]